MYIGKKSGLKIDPWGTPGSIGDQEDNVKGGDCREV